jgi:hypothetical protein
MVSDMPREEIYLTEMSLKELAEGKIIYDDDGEIVIYPPTTYELSIIRLSDRLKKIGE